MSTSSLIKGYLDRYDQMETELDWLSRDREVYAPFAEDPKANFVFTNAGFRDLFRLLKNVSGPRWSRQVPKGLPILIMSGDMDPVGQFGEGPKKVAGWLREAGGAGLDPQAVRGRAARAA